MKSFFIFVFICSPELLARTLIFQSSESQSNAAATIDRQPSSSGGSAQVVQPAGGPSVSSELFFMVEQLTQEVMTLRGLVEEQGYLLNQLQGASKDRYSEIDGRLMSLTQRLDGIENNRREDVAGSTNLGSVQASPSVQSSSKVVGAAVISSAVVPAASAAVVGEEASDQQKAEYQAAYNYVKAKDFSNAVNALHAYVEKYPDGDLTGNAFYWLGEVYLAMPKLEQAKQAFTIVVKTFPGHRKLADAMYKLAVAHDRLQEPADAEVYLKRVQQEYPNSTAARLAKNYAMER